MSPEQGTEQVIRLVSGVDKPTGPECMRLFVDMVWAVLSCVGGTEHRIMSEASVRERTKVSDDPVSRCSPVSSDIARSKRP